jgi:hypothetical protein
LTRGQTNYPEIATRGFRSNPQDVSTEFQSSCDCATNRRTVPTTALSPSGRIIGRAAIVPTLNVNVGDVAARMALATAEFRIPSNDTEISSESG